MNFHGCVRLRSAAAQCKDCVRVCSCEDKQRGVLKPPVPGSKPGTGFPEM